jgi:hypothetical protein
VKRALSQARVWVATSVALHQEPVPIEKLSAAVNNCSNDYLLVRMLQWLRTCHIAAEKHYFDDG